MGIRYSFAVIACLLAAKLSTASPLDDYKNWRITEQQICLSAKAKGLECDEYKRTRKDDAEMKWEYFSHYFVSPIVERGYELVWSSTPYPGALLIKGGQYFSLDMKGKAIPLFIDADNQVHFGAQDGPVYEYLVAAYDDGILAPERRKKEQAEKARIDQEEIKTLASRNVHIKSDEAFLVHMKQTNLMIIGSDDFGKRATGRIVKGCGRAGGMGPNRCCLSFTGVPSPDKQWTIKPFEEDVNVQVTTNSDKYSEFKITPEEVADPNNTWSLTCGTDHYYPLEKLLAQGGITLTKSDPDSFFDPKKPDAAARTAFSIVPRSGAFEHLPAGTEIKLSHGFTLVPNHRTYRLASGGPMQCRVVVDKLAQIRSISPNTILKLKDSSTYTEISQYVRGDRSGVHRVWKWNLSAPAGIHALECKQEVGNFFDVYIEAEGMSASDVQTSMNPLMEIVTPDGTTFPIHQFSEKNTCPYGRCNPRYWEGFKLHNQSFELDQWGLEDLPDGTQIELLAGNAFSIPTKSTSLSLTSEKSDIQCKVDLPTTSESKLRQIKTLRLVVVDQVKSYWDNDFMVSSGDKSVEKLKVSCTRTNGKKIRISELQGALDPRLTLRFPTAVEVNNPAPVPTGNLVLRDRYRECEGEVASSYQFEFNKDVPISAGSSSLELGNGCKMHFSSHGKDRTIKKGDMFTANKWKYSRSVEEIQNEHQHGFIEARGTEIPQGTIQSVTCLMASAYEADTDERLTCDNEFDGTLTQTASGAVGSFKAVKNALIVNTGSFFK